MRCLRCGAESDRVWCPTCVARACCSRHRRCVHTEPAKKGVAFAAAALAAASLLAGCSSPSTEVAAVEKVKARKTLEEAQAFHDEAQKAIDEAEAAVREAERVIAEQTAAAARERAVEAAKARAARSATTVRPRPSETPTADVWGRLAACESGGNPRAVGGGGRYFGAFQFSLGTWRSVGGTGNPIDHDYGTQLSFAQKLQARSGWGQWPHCARKLGLI